MSDEKTIQNGNATPSPIQLAYGPEPDLKALVAEARGWAHAIIYQKGDERKSRQATEVVDSVFRQMLQNQPGELERLMQSPGEFRKFMNRAIRNRLISYARERGAEKRPKVHPQYNLHDNEFDDLVANGLVTFAEEHPAAAADLAETLAWLELAEPRAALVIQLRFFEGLTFPEIARETGLSEKTVKRACYDGLYLLRKKMGVSPGSSGASGAP